MPPPPAPRLESQGCRLIPLFCLLSCYLHRFVATFDFFFFCFWPILLSTFRKFLLSFFQKQLRFVGYGPCFNCIKRLEDVNQSVICAACCLMTMVLFMYALIFLIFFPDLKNNICLYLVLINQTYVSTTAACPSDSGIVGKQEQYRRDYFWGI